MFHRTPRPVSSDTTSGSLGASAGGGGRGLLLAALMACTFLTALDVMVVGTAMPTIVAQLGGISLYTWVFSSYLLASTVTVPVYGKLADVYGRKPLFTFGTLVFLLGSALCGLAQDMTQLILFRVVQGLGAGAVFPITLTIVGDQFPLEERARTIGLFSAVWGVAGIVGPLVGGFLTDYWSWRWIFWLNLPIGVVALAMLWATFRERVTRRQVRVDWLGAAVLTAALTVLMLALLEAAATLPSVSATLAGLLLLGALLLGFCGWHTRRVPEPILPLHLLRRRLILVSGLCTFLAGAHNAGVGTFVPVFAQGVLGGTATAAGAVLIPTSFTWPIGSAIGGRLLLKLGYRGVSVLGTAVVAVGSGGLALLDGTSGAWPILLAVGIIGLGMGLSMANFTIAAQNAVPWEERGVATSISQFFRSIGQAIGVTALGAAFTVQMGSRLGQAGQDLSITNAVLDPLARQALDPTLLAGVRGILGDSLHGVFLLMLAVGAANLVLAAQMPSGSAKEHAWTKGPTS